MEGLDLKQLGEMVKVIADEKGLPEETVLDVVQMAIAAAWRRENGDREMEVRALLDTHTGKAKVFVVKQVIEDGLMSLVLAPISSWRRLGGITTTGYCLFPKLPTPLCIMPGPAFV